MRIRLRVGTRAHQQLWCGARAMPRPGKPTASPGHGIIFLRRTPKCDPRFNFVLERLRYGTLCTSPGSMT